MLLVYHNDIVKYFSKPSGQCVGYKFIHGKYYVLFDTLEIGKEIYIFDSVNYYNKKFAADVSEDEFSLFFNNIEIMFETLEDQEYFTKYSYDSDEKRLRFSHVC